MDRINPYWHVPTGDGPHCQVCGGSWPDGHYADCPVKTGEPVAGQLAQQGQQSDLEWIEQMCETIEHLLDSLRELRRKCPEEFFGRPQERLYESLEAALGSFYASRVSGEPRQQQNAS